MLLGSVAVHYMEVEAGLGNGFFYIFITIHWIGVVIYMSQRVVRKFRDSLFYSPLAGLRIPLIITKLKLNRSRNPYTMFDQ